jgi:hypothetical protein
VVVGVGIVIENTGVFTLFCSGARHVAVMFDTT